MKYHANFNANNGTRLIQDRESDNKGKLISDIREIAEANRFENSECSWNVYETSTGRCVAAGGMHNNGRRYRIDKAALHLYDCWG